MTALSNAASFVNGMLAAVVVVLAAVIINDGPWKFR